MMAHVKTRNPVNVKEMKRADTAGVNKYAKDKKSKSKLKQKLKNLNQRGDRGEPLNIELQSIDLDKADEALLKAKKKILDDAFKKVDREELLFREVDFSDQEDELEGVVPAKRAKGIKLPQTSQSAFQHHKAIYKSTPQTQTELKIGKKTPRPEKLELHENSKREMKLKLNTSLQSNKISNNSTLIARKNTPNKLKRKAETEMVEIEKDVKAPLKKILKIVPEQNNEEERNVLLPNYYLPEKSIELICSSAIMMSSDDEEVSASNKKVLKGNILSSSCVLETKHAKNMLSETILPSTSKSISKNTFPLKEQLEQLIKKNKTRRRPLRVDGLELRQQMMERMKAAQFRLINEKLYTSSGEEAKQLFQKTPEAFETYHEGFRQQVKRWPVNPINEIIARIKKMPRSKVISDMGCGDATLAKSVPHKVHSFDLVASAPGVVACDIARTPLPKESVDVVVFCLALMGTELQKYLAEANRILKEHGKLLIAEVESRFEDVEDFVAGLKKLGFKANKINKKYRVFLFMEFTKIADCPSRRPHITLKPCLYKKR